MNKNKKTLSPLQFYSYVTNKKSVYFFPILQVRNYNTDFLEGQAHTSQDVAASEIQKIIIKQVSELRRMRRKRMQQTKSPLTQEGDSYYKSLLAGQLDAASRRRGKPAG